MPYNIAWHTESVVIVLVLVGDVPSDEFRAFNDDIVTLIDSVDRTLTHIIIDFSQALSYPTKVAEIRAALGYLQHQRIGWTLIVTHDQLAKFVISTVVQMSQARFRAFESFGEAVQFLGYVDASVDLGDFESDSQ